MPDNTWVDAMACDEVEEDFPAEVTLKGRYLAVYRHGERFFATDGFCTHEDAKLCDGYLDGEVIECPLHQARFNIVTGQVLGPPATANLTIYPVQVRDGRVLVQLDAGGEDGRPD
ncbi:MAG: non-heme iron oxygenase ferredoxin subunit [Kiloniellales bacterium]|nr:non-heme iron oxygenase ferredoxin subunit [Kiloniellales bacterium]